jgi:hypothetical protein
MGRILNWKKNEIENKKALISQGFFTLRCKLQPE